MDYREKYLKYKIKYLDLKNLIGAGKGSAKGMFRERFKSRNFN